MSSHAAAQRRGATARDAATGQSVKRLGSGLPFLIPFIVVAVLFLVIPVLYGFWLSFTEQSLMGNGGFVGLGNYVEAFGDPTMWSTLGHTIMFTVMSTIPLVLIALVMALLVYIGIPGQWLWRLAFFAPYLLPVAVVVQVWTWLFNSDVGFINYWIQQIGLDKVGWLTDVDVAMWSMVILTVWWTVGFNFLLYLSSLQAIPDLLYEAAEVDGAGFWRKIWSVTLPQLRGTTVLVATLQVIASLKIFDQMFIAFNGGSGPEGSTRPILQYIYDTGFTNYRMGYASAMSYIFFAVIIVITVAFQLLTRPRKDKNNER
ncbi:MULTISPECIES: sugar ABC transporter permease [unclassified Actinomyces]|uniref:carbohydrate ABC transporter permease n=1 Tax=unclassified Actinomyces TaxID=2609248 RepID=UPI002016FC58|nr:MULTISPECIES: sugar ABC transporter permease [unclassified Actinomyces]MCL3777123.1 sugar ABC transporter permease [Actinomyces sp. AC-20-1]MCL3788961.1 sugar ABC transporter permease [Actinomyces sp. 187325]MCL3791309.1 sugar ABC transporter permease [Actinomyces sp. 186855]MCL3794140.1 sugar ABC transporter permease [Actinomyces sp. 217892]